MEIILYENISEYNKINKTLMRENKLYGQMVNETSVTNPSILIEIPTLTPYNYLYIPELGRYYFITDIVNVRTNLWRIATNVDVLMSFKNEILNQSVIIDKQENDDDASKYLDDGSYVTENRTFTEILNYPNGFNENPEYILITAGGGINA